MILLSKIFKALIPIFCISLSLMACEKEDTDEYVYSFGITSAIDGNSSEIEIIELAYSDAYKMNGIKYNSQSFAPGTSKKMILKSCKQAEDAILSSDKTFEGRYVYEVKSKDIVIYQRIYGVR
jgi:hypothetical protein